MLPSCTDVAYFHSKDSQPRPLCPKGSCVRSSGARAIFKDKKSDAQAGHTLSSGPSIMCVWRAGRGAVARTMMATPTAVGSAEAAGAREKASPGSEQQWG